MSQQAESSSGAWTKLERLAIRLTWMCERLAGLRWRIGAYGDLAKIYMYLAYPCRTEANYHYVDTAAALYHRSLLISETLGDEEGIGMSCSGLGYVRHRRADLDDAERWHKRALAVHTELKRRELMAQDYDALGYIYRCRRNGSEVSAEMFYKALALWRGVGDEKQIAWSLSNAARGFYHAERYDRARELVWEAAMLHEKLRDVPGMAWDYYFCGLICWHAAEMERAQDYLRRSLTKFDECKNEMLAKQVRGYLDALSSEGR